MDGTSRCGVQWARRCCARVIGWGRQLSSSGLVSYTCIAFFICPHSALKHFKATAKHRCGLLWIKITRPPPIFCALVVPPNDLRRPVLFETGSANYRCSNFGRISSTSRAIRLLHAVLDRDHHSCIHHRCVQGHAASQSLRLMAFAFIKCCVVGATQRVNFGFFNSAARARMCTHTHCNATM